MVATLYDLLGIDKSASPAEGLLPHFAHPLTISNVRNKKNQVRRAFKQKALETHPDKFLGPGASKREKQAAEARFHKVREAFEILNDPQKRRVRDFCLQSDLLIFFRTVLRCP